MLEQIKFIIYLIFSFDTDYLFVQKGGAAPNEANSKNNTNNTLNKIENEEDAEKYWGQNIFNEYYEIFRHSIMSAIKWLQSTLMNWIVIPILFASVSPAVPFIAVMSLLSAVMKYFMYHFRKL